MAITIKEILSNDVNLVNKLNFNFDQIMLSGGGPIGNTGATGEGIPGERGKRGLNIYTFNNIPQPSTGDTTFIGDIYIGSTGATGFNRGKVYRIGTTGAALGNYTDLNLTGATGDKGATGNTGYSGGIELYSGGAATNYGGISGIQILSSVDSDNNPIGTGATGVNIDEIGFMMPFKQRVGYVFANKQFTSSENGKFLNLNRHLGTSSGTIAAINENSAFKNLTPKSIFIQDELNIVTNNGISFGAYNLKSTYEFPRDNSLQLGTNATNPRIGYSTSATSDFIDFVNFGFRLKSVPTNNPEVTNKYVTEYLINSESLPITISAGGVKNNTDNGIVSRREPSDLTLRGNRIIFETYDGKSGFYNGSGTFINGTANTEANKILFKSPSYFESNINITSNTANIITTKTTNNNNLEIIKISDNNTNSTNTAVSVISAYGTALKVRSNYGTGLDINSDYGTALKISANHSTTLNVTGGSLFNGSVNIINNLVLNGELTVGLNAIFNQNLTTSTISISNNATIGGTLSVAGHTTFNHHVNISNTKSLTCGPINATNGNFSSNVGINGTLGVTGAATFKNNIKIEGVVGINTAPDTNFKLKIDGNSYINGGLSIGTDALDSYKLKVVGDSYFESSNNVTLQINNNADNKALHISAGRSQFNKVGIGADNTSSDILRIIGTSYFSGATVFNSLITLNSGLTISNGGIITANYAKGNVANSTSAMGYVPAVKAFGRISSGALQYGYNIESASKQDTGKYTIVFKGGINLDSSVINATVVKNDGNSSFNIHIVTSAGNTATFFISNVAGTLVNGDFYVTVFSL